MRAHELKARAPVMRWVERLADTDHELEPDEPLHV